MNFCYKTAVLCLHFLVFSADGKRNRSKDRGFILNWHGFTPGKIAETSETLSKLRQQRCGLRDIEISFSREEMNKIGIAPNQISLNHAADRSCYAITNETHYSLHIYFESDNLCGTRATFTEISNVVKVFPPQISMEKLAESLKSVDDEDTDVEGSGFEGSGDMAIRQVNDVLSSNAKADNVISLPFKCTYGPTKDLPEQSHPPRRTTTSESPKPPRRTTTSESPKLHYPVVPIDDNSYLLTFYKQPGFMTEFQPSTPAVYKSTTLYGQVQPLAIGKKGLLRSCFLSDKQSVSVDDTPSSRVYFIESGCASSDGVQLAQFDDKSRLESRFQFNIRKKFDTFTFIHCEVEPCTWQNSGGLTKCVSQADYCQSQTSPTKLHTVRWHHTVKVINKPRTLSNGIPDEIPEPCTYQEPVCNCPVFSDDLTKSDTTVAAATETRLRFVTVIIIAIASFCIGVLLVIALWCVHVKTDPRRNMMPVRSEEGDSQNSRTPIRCDQTESVESQKLTCNYHT